MGRSKPTDILSIFYPIDTPYLRKQDDDMHLL